ncbi:putative mitochondrial flagellar protofilament ribbon protein-like protein [Leptomonas pyrrhocoris]|uniref:Putative mitochondrial flagellar protofilament ribbon protein-like protein n=1 Tax=Leptomonas pyrrhocoris TaxID=157538 RepID=A0A0M9FU95_LEPPY|nr:putative mitochondrial flagellar protofilament ribbon protein-like protein [Leptomonas pyrrhocoris]XP_015654509.1 putative mitochondrial flagellar protofilament ribbon protein-like protein [Leptomonas pyrrhocoris]XP_015654510.1 putative mitochondrial flagellar protofilament ribbon protein-like protein [Leptomonas pyrrhocoris]KPA76069.1 putative mitochondrial flagellar protofilament ribbon protein-like protein [Leptomonas pyrrhocoris]KPA76070.1 putative mitochondrial flagellar protofilament r|eukprot:XP_015654508.1 putative mitochondrial flagellar protofilament ribbon protein-like protein [Leptomonas pyrrhocoris]
MESAAQSKNGFDAASSRGAAVSSPNGTGPVTTQVKKQLFMSQRAERLKDPKVRKMGIDREALDAQVREMEALRRLEKERNDYYDRQALLMDRHACALQQEVNAIRSAREKEMQDYRKTFQKKELGREWDLNDPEAKRKDLPARVGDDDPRNGPSSLQKFEGEDLDYAARRAAQQRQQREWAQQQVNEKLAKKWMEQERDRAYDDRNEETNNRLHETERNIAEQRRLMEKNAADFNRALAEQQRREAVRAKEENDRLGLEEIAYQMDSDFLNERETVVGELGATVKAERYKGLTDKQKSQFREDQDEQLSELRRRRLLEVEEKKQWAQQEHMQLRMANALDRQRERERRAEREKLAETHKMQAEASAQRKADLDKLYTNQVDEDYFKYWDRAL